ncbi:hypothetical protein HGRIS_012317 [Hohenbuehelia grisea]|uniref:Uncharacterized protein n=1 Tax=Hohenbuehelia grisea TaxID=104357 RepID=A0ABR3IRZ0_9AGAR
MDHDMDASFSPSPSSSASSTVLVFPSTTHSRHNPSEPATVHEADHLSCPSSPAVSIGLPSPPGSPSLTDSGSISSLPSVSSSFFFSSAAASPPPPPHAHPHPHVQGSHDQHENSNPYPQAHDHAGHHLVIPSLALPTALRQPTAYGQALGDVRLIVVRLTQASKRSAATAGPNDGARGDTSRQPVFESMDMDYGRMLVEDIEDIVDVGPWEAFKPRVAHSDGQGTGDAAAGSTEPPRNDRRSSWKTLHASTDWIEHHDAHGLEKFEPAKNVEVLEVTIEVPSLSDNSEAEGTRSIKSSIAPSLLDLRDLILTSYYDLASVLNPSLPPYTSPLVHSLASASTSPLFAALILVHDTHLSPIIDFSHDRIHMGRRRRSSKLALESSFVAAERAVIQALSPYIPIISPPTLSTLSFGSLHHIHPRAVLQAPTLSLLRGDAADHFLRWYEIERIVSSSSTETAVAGLASPALEDNAPSLYAVPQGSPTDKGKGRLISEGDGTDSQPTKSPKRRAHDEDFARRRLIWEADLSADVARRRRSEPYSTQSPPLTARPSSAASLRLGDSIMSSTYSRVVNCAPAHVVGSPPFDPLHLPSVLWLSLSLIGPLGRRAGQEVLGLLSGGRASGSEEPKWRGERPDSHRFSSTATVTPRRRNAQSQHQSRQSGYLAALGQATWAVGVVGIVGIGVGFLVGVGCSFLR